MHKIVLTLVSALGISGPGLLGTQAPAHSPAVTAVTFIATYITELLAGPWPSGKFER